jgi:hypothetical protein
MLPIAVPAAAGAAGLLLALASQGGRLPQLYCYLVSLMTGYVVTAMLEEDLGLSTQEGICRSGQLIKSLCLASRYSAHEHDILTL